MSFYRSVLFQMLTAGIIALLGPGLWNAINSLGAAGALEPYLVNAANSLVFGLMGLFCVLSPLFVNSFGVKKTLILGTLGWSVYSGALYQNNRYGTEWFVIFGAAICGISAGLYWAAEGTIILSYPEYKTRGRYLALWLAFKNSGQIIGGAINLGINAHRKKAGKVSYATLLVFVVLQAIPAPFAFFLSSPEKVERKDGTPVVVESKTNLSAQLRLLWKAISTPQIGLLLPIFFSSWAYWGYSSTFLTLYFSVRARALASFLSAISGIIATTILGIFLDSQRFTVRTKIRWGFAVVITLFSSMWIWVGIIQHEYSHHKPATLDWDTPGFGRGFGMYIMLGTFGNLVQNYLYFLVGTIGDGTSQLSRSTGLLRGVESWGQCVSFGISSSHFSPFYTVVIILIFWVVSVPPAAYAVWLVEGRFDPLHDKAESLESERSSPTNVNEKVKHGDSEAQWTLNSAK